MNPIVLIIVQLRYFILFPIAAFEGPIATLIAGFLVSLGILELWPAFIVILLADFIPDIIFYCIGRNRSYMNHVDADSNSRTKVISGSLGTIKKLWETHPRKTMLFAKLSYGVSMPFLISAGMAKIPLRKFISYTLPVTLLQCPIIFFIGYYLGQTYIVAQKYVSYWVPFTLLIIILLTFLYIVVARLFKKEFAEFEE